MFKTQHHTVARSTAAKTSPGLRDGLKICMTAQMLFYGQTWKWCRSFLRRWKLGDVSNSTVVQMAALDGLPLQDCPWMGHWGEDLAPIGKLSSATEPSAPPKIITSLFSKCIISFVQDFHCLSLPSMSCARI